MTAFPTYSTGTVAVANGATTVIGTGTTWSGTNARPGDDIVVDGHTVVVLDVTDPTHLVIDAWPYTTVSAGATYKIIKRSPLRFAGGDAMADVSTLVAALNTDGFYVFVSSTLTVPDPSYGNDNQFAFQPSTSKLWLKTGGVWVLQGIFKGFNITGAWSGATAYAVNDVVSLSGSSYVCILAHTNHTPPNATYWALLASIGNTGGTGPAAWSPPAAWLTATAYVAGPPASVVVQGGETYVCLVSHTSGTFATDLAAAKWIKVAQKGTGDVLASNNGTEFTAATFATNLALLRYGASQSLTAAQKTQVQQNAGVPAVLIGRKSGLTLSTAGVSSSFAAAAGVAADSTGTDMMALASSLQKNTGAWTVGVNGGALDTGTIAINTWYHAFLIKRPDTGVVDVLVSLSATAPTLPTNYTLFRRIGSLRVDASSNWRKFIQFGNFFLWDAMNNDVAGVTVGTTALTPTIFTPLGVRVKALLHVGYTNATVGHGLLVTSPDVSDQAPTGGNPNVGFVQVTSQVALTSLEEFTNTSSQIRARSSAASGTYYVWTYGWQDFMLEHGA